MNALRIMALSYFFGMLFAGCAFQGYPNPPRASSIAQNDPNYLVEPKLIEEYNALTAPEERRQFRNIIIDERMLEIDHQFDEFQTDLWKQGVGMGVATDWVLLAISGVTATSGGVAVKAALGAASAGITGARASFDKNTLADQTLPALMAEMVAARKSWKATIEASKKLDDADYSLYSALSDLQNLMQAGSIPGAIQAIAIDAGEKASKADVEIKSIREISFSRDDASKLLRRFWKPDGVHVNQEHKALLLDWMTRHGLPAGPGDIPMFLADPNEAGNRAMAAKELIK